jgi:hypothetical protein
VEALAGLLTRVRLTWWVGVEPRSLWSRPWLRSALTRVLRDDRLMLLTRATGVDLAHSRELGLAGYAAGPRAAPAVMMLARHDADPVEVERRFRTRLTGNEIRAVEGHQLVRVSGTIGEGTRAFVRVGRDVAGFQWGGSAARGPARIAALYANGELSNVPSVALAQRELPSLAQAPIALWFPGPFEDDRARGARGLLGGASDVTLTAKPTADEALAIAIDVLGDYRSGGDEAVALMTKAWGDLAGSPLGTLLGLDTPRRAPRVELLDASLQLRVVLDPKALFDGLASLTVDDTRTIFAAPTP